LKIQDEPNPYPIREIEDSRGKLVRDAESHDIRDLPGTLQGYR
jgi:hypothetical protein